MKIREVFHTPIQNDQIGAIMTAMLRAEQARIDATPKPIKPPIARIDRDPVVRLALVKGKVSK